MFGLASVLEYIVVTLIVAMLYFLCTRDIFCALQKKGHNGREYARWTHKKGNMIYSRYILLAFLIALSSLVLGVCLSFFGKWAAYFTLIPCPLFAAIFCVAQKRTAKTSCTYTSRLVRVGVLDVLLTAVLTFLLVLGGNAAAFYAGSELLSCFRYILIAAVPLFLPVLLRIANALDTPYSRHAEEKEIRAAAEKTAKLPCRIICITGGRENAGDSGVKHFLGSILSEQYNVLILPEICRYPSQAAQLVDRFNFDGVEYLIADLGAVKAGDIKEICRVLRPDHCIITGIPPVPCGMFSSAEEMRASAQELLDATKDGGCAVVASDRGAGDLDFGGKRLSKVSVGEHGECGALKIRSTACGIDFKLAIGVREAEVHSRLLGLENAYDLALAAAMVYKLGMKKEEIVQGIENINYVPHNLQPFVRDGITFLDDDCNTTALSAGNALDVLKLFGGRKILITPGIIREGILDPEENRKFGAQCVGLSRVIVIGETLVLPLKEGYLEAGGDPEKLSVVSTVKKAAELLGKEAEYGDTVLCLNRGADPYDGE